MVKQHEQYKAKNETATVEIRKLQEALDEMQDLHQQLLEQGAPGANASQVSQATDASQSSLSGAIARSRGNTDDYVDPPARVQPGEIGTNGNSEFEPLVCLDCANALCQAKPEVSVEEMAELRLQTTLLTERCRDLK